MDLAQERLLKDVTKFGFINGQIKFGGFDYKVRLITNEEFKIYGNMIEKNASEALKYVLSICIFREKKRLFRKEKKRIFDFSIEKYPVALTEKFTRDLFVILLDKDFFRYLEERGGCIEK